MNEFAFSFVLALIFMAGFMSFVLAHEATHLALADEAYGICLGRCPYRSPELSPSEGITFASAFGEHNDASSEELWPNVAGLVALSVVVFLGAVCLFVVEGKGSGFFPSHEEDLRREEMRKKKLEVK